MDNAPNNDTLLEHLARKFESVGIFFDAIAARIRCMPHTAHLAALKVCFLSFLIFCSNYFAVARSYRRYIQGSP